MEGKQGKYMFNLVGNKGVHFENFDHKVLKAMATMRE